MLKKLGVLLSFKLLICTLFIAIDLKAEEIRNLENTSKQVQLVRIGRPAEVRESVVNNPNGTQDIKLDLSDGSFFKVRVPAFNLQVEAPSGSEVTEVSLIPGLKKTHIKAPNGQFVDIIIPNLNTFPNLEASVSGNPQSDKLEAVEQVLNRIENLHKLNELLERYNNDLSLVKNDPKFTEIKPALHETYQMLSSVPFLLSIATSGVDMFKAQVEEAMAEKAKIKGFENLNEDVQGFMDHTFSYADTFIEFVKKFAKHFTENKIVKELLAD